jgi:pentatricopeptide repeat protein
MAGFNCPPSIFSMTALINAYAKLGYFEKAEEVFQGMREMGFDPDVYTYNALMQAYKYVLILTK